MTVSLHLVSYNRKKETKNFILQIQPWNSKTSLVGYDVTNNFSSVLKEDNKNRFDAFTGPAFTHEAYRALTAAYNHAYLSHVWYVSSKSQDEDFGRFVQSYMSNAKSSEDFYEDITKLRKSMNMPVKNIREANDVDILDFRPKINYKGVWKNYKPECMEIIKTWDHGTFFKNK